MAQKPSIPKGTRDFSPTEVAKRSYIISIIKRHFETFGFQPIETPSFENSETLLGKYGEEGDRLIFKILNSGIYLTDSHLIFKFYGWVKEYFSKDFFCDFYNQFDHDTEIAVKEGDFSKLTDKEKNKVRNDFLRYEKKKRELLELEKERAIDGLLNKYMDIVIPSTYTIVALMKKDFDNESLWISHVNRVTNKLIEAYFSKEISPKIAEKALRYDLTVPFARYVVMHRNDIELPFKRYQIQPVWRADRPQKGRFREFYQCDADVVGANSLLQEVEFVQLYDSVFTELGLEGCTIKLNNRKILSGIAEVIGAKDLLIDFTVALDKLDKIGVEKVKEEMLAKGISDEAIKKASPLFEMSGDSGEQLNQLKGLLADSEVGMQGVGELNEILELVQEVGLNSAKLQLDVTLARGLNYYTGAIFEVAAPERVKMGSIGGGGRYDDLTGIFGLNDVSGVGISFGLDRIYLVLEELGLFPQTIEQSLDVLCLNFGDKEAKTALKLVTELRKYGLRADLYPISTKVQKQFKYADKRGVPNVILLGASELEKQVFVVKNMKSGEQKEYSLNNIQEFATSL